MVVVDNQYFTVVEISTFILSSVIFWLSLSTGFLFFSNSLCKTHENADF